MIRWKLEKKDFKNREESEEWLETLMDILKYKDYLRIIKSRLDKLNTIKLSEK